MFMNFGNFLEGMRLSQADIADRAKMELNKRYMESQMETMALGREGEKLNQRLTGMQIDRMPVDWAQKDEAHGLSVYNTKRNIFADDIAGSYDTESQFDPTEAFAAGLDRTNAIRAEAKLPPVPYTGMVKTDEGRYRFLNQKGVPVGDAMDTDTAIERSAGVLGGKWGGLDRKARESRERASGSGSRPNISIHPVAADALRAKREAAVKLAAMRTDFEAGILTPEEWKKAVTAYEETVRHSDELVQSMNAAGVLMYDKTDPNSLKIDPYADLPRRPPPAEEKDGGSTPSRLRVGDRELVVKRDGKGKLFVRDGGETYRMNADGNFVSRSGKVLPGTVPKKPAPQAGKVAGSILSEIQ